MLSSLGYNQTYIDVTDQYIQNPSFEEYTACPQTNSAYPTDMWIDSVVGWYAPTAGTSDYFNACTTGTNNAPNGYLSGYQVPFDGVGFCGFYAYGNDYTQNDRMWCEYVQTQLLMPLKINGKYKFSMRIAKGNDYTLTVKNIGANFTEFANMDFTDTKPYNLTPTILNNTGFITDTLGWTLVSGEFTATGNENYLTIGWFGDTITDDFTFFIPPEIDSITGELIYDSWSYYLVDSLKIFEIQPSVIDFEVNVITPNGDNINDVIDFSAYQFQEFNFTVINRWGNVVWQTNDPNAKWDGKTSTGDLVNDGVYFYRLIGVDYYENKIEKNSFVQVVR